MKLRSIESPVVNATLIIFMFVWFSVADEQDWSDKKEEIWCGLGICCLSGIVLFNKMYTGFSFWRTLHRDIDKDSIRLG